MRAKGKGKAPQSRKTPGQGQFRVDNALKPLDPNREQLQPSRPTKRVCNQPLSTNCQNIVAADPEGDVTNADDTVPEREKCLNNPTFSVHPSTTITSVAKRQKRATEVRFTIENLDPVIRDKWKKLFNQYLADFFHSSQWMEGCDRDENIAALWRKHFAADAEVVHAQALREREERVAAGEVDVPEPELPSPSPEQMRAVTSL
jgi:hypothetical protein